MLTNLTVKNLALFKDISVDFDGGLNILTGETGAGKSILIGSALLALGGRYTSDMIRTGEKAGYVELSFSVDDSLKDMVHRIDEEIDLSDGLLIISRKLSEGRSSSRINGESVTQKRLRDIASLLLDVHGQRDSQILLEAGGHKSLLDDFGSEGLHQARRETESAYRALTETKRAIDQIGEDQTQRQREIDLLSYEVEEISQAQLEEGEDDALESAYARLSHAQQIYEGLAKSQEALSGDGEGNASDLIARSMRALAAVRRFDEKSDALYDQLSQIDSLLSDVSREIDDTIETFEYSPEETDRISRRLDEINRLKGKYGATIAEIKAEEERKQERLEALENAEETLAKLTETMENQRAALLDKCAVLSEGRKRYASLMEKEIAAGLSELQFADNRFEIRVERADSIGPDGYDEVTFWIGPNPGEPMKELSRIASGGELSRIMLAVKTVMAGREREKTLIFDEIDAGISGRTAEAVAQRLCEIAQTHQVICITHLAQIASMADAHYRIEKDVAVVQGQEQTTTHIHVMTEQESIHEIARILGGTHITDAALENAKEMQHFAEIYKKKNTVCGI